MARQTTNEFDNNKIVTILGSPNMQYHRCTSHMKVLLELTGYSVYDASYVFSDLANLNEQDVNRDALTPNIPNIREIIPDILGNIERMIDVSDFVIVNSCSDYDINRYLRYQDPTGTMNASDVFLSDYDIFISKSVNYALRKSKPTITQCINIPNLDINVDTIYLSGLNIPFHRINGKRKDNVYIIYDTKNTYAITNMEKYADRINSWGEITYIDASFRSVSGFFRDHKITKNDMLIVYNDLKYSHTLSNNLISFISTALLRGNVVYSKYEIESSIFDTKGYKKTATINGDDGFSETILEEFYTIELRKDN